MLVYIIVGVATAAALFFAYNVMSKGKKTSPNELFTSNKTKKKNNQKKKKNKENKQNQQQQQPAQQQSKNATQKNKIKKSKTTAKTDKPVEENVDGDSSFTSVDIEDFYRMNRQQPSKDVQPPRNTRVHSQQQQQEKPQQKAQQQNQQDNRRNQNRHKNRYEQKQQTVGTQSKKNKATGSIYRKIENDDSAKPPELMATTQEKEEHEQQKKQQQKKQQKQKEEKKEVKKDNRKQEMEPKPKNKKIKPRAEPSNLIKNPYLSADDFWEDNVRELPKPNKKHSQIEREQHEKQKHSAEDAESQQHHTQTQQKSSTDRSAAEKSNDGPTKNATTATNTDTTAAAAYGNTNGTPKSATAEKPQVKVYSTAPIQSKTTPWENTRTQNPQKAAEDDDINFPTISGAKKAEKKKKQKHQSTAEPSENRETKNSNVQSSDIQLNGEKQKTQADFGTSDIQPDNIHKRESSTKFEYEMDAPDEKRTKLDESVIQNGGDNTSHESDENDINGTVNSQGSSSAATEVAHD